MKQKKADFQMSLGMIVALVLAVILLTLAIAWMQGMFGQISSITFQVTDTAKQAVIDEIASSGKKVGIAAPAVTKWKRGDTGAYSIIVKNEDFVISKTYVINIVDQNHPDASTWLTYAKEIPIDAGGVLSVPLVIKPATNALPGIYYFTITVNEKGNTAIYGTTFFSLEII